MKNENKNDELVSLFSTIDANLRNLYNFNIVTDNLTYNFSIIKLCYLEILKLILAFFKKIIKNEFYFLLKI